MLQCRVLPVEDNPDNLAKGSIAAGAIASAFDSLEIPKSGLPNPGVVRGFNLK